MPPKPTTRGKNVGLRKGTTQLPPDTEIIAGLSQDTASLFPVPQPTAKKTSKRPRSQDTSPSNSDHSDDDNSVISLKTASSADNKKTKTISPLLNAAKTATTSANSDTSPPTAPSADSGAAQTTPDTELVHVPIADPEVTPTYTTAEKGKSVVLPPVGDPMVEDDPHTTKALHFGLSSFLSFLI